MRGAARVYTELGDLVEVWRQAPRQALARLHTLAARDLVDRDHLGQPATDDATARLTQLADLLAATRAPALVVAAVVHGELATLRPFGSADRVVAMAASRLVLVERGLDPGGVRRGRGRAPRPRVRRSGAARVRRRDRSGRRRPGCCHYGDVVRAGVQESLAIAESILRG